MSTTHIAHEDVHEGGLVDGCPRCEEHSYHPLRGLDNETLRRLMERVVNEEAARSDNEERAMLEIKKALDEAGALAELNPILFAKYQKRTRGVRLIAVL